MADGTAGRGAAGADAAGADAAGADTAGADAAGAADGRPPGQGDGSRLIRVAELPQSERDQMRAMLHQTPLHALLGIEIVELGAAHSILSMPVREQAFNSTGNLHGGAIATLIDVAAGTAAAMGSGFQPGKQSLVTADLHVRYLGRPHGDLVFARAEVLKTGRQLIVVGCGVTDSEGRLIASADFSMMIVALRAPLRPTAGATPTDPDL
jgi:uncharacterized protein (TIGR00369 family)